MNRRCSVVAWLSSVHSAVNCEDCAGYVGRAVRQQPRGAFRHFIGLCSTAEWGEVVEVFGYAGLTSFPRCDHGRVGRAGRDGIDPNLVRAEIDGVVKKITAQAGAPLPVAAGSRGGRGAAPASSWAGTSGRPSRTPTTQSSQAWWRTTHVSQSMIIAASAGPSPGSPGCRGGR